LHKHGRETKQGYVWTKDQLCGMSEKNAVKREIKMRIAISVGEDEEFQLTIGKGRLPSLEE